MKTHYSSGRVFHCNWKNHSSIGNLVKWVKQNMCIVQLSACEHICKWHIHAPNKRCADVHSVLSFQKREPNKLQLSNKKEIHIESSRVSNHSGMNELKTFWASFNM